MKTHYIEIPKEKWGIVLIHDFDVDREYNELSAIMKSFGMKGSRIGYALSVLNTHNSGLTISNDGLKMSVMFIGHATSKAQFLNSLAHENVHVATAIVDYYQEPCDGESMAYLSGYLMQRIIEEIADIEY